MCKLSLLGVKSGDCWCIAGIIVGRQRIGGLELSEGPCATRGTKVGWVGGCWESRAVRRG